ncbi:MAG: DoxX family protein [Candidatus Marinimicrobia bacterium]|nr:DoxX family protein [Candidatus Neomarinimicrobiota bacterium]
MNKKNKTDKVLLLLRIVLGLIFIAHGSQKLLGIFGGSGISGTISMLKSMGFFLPTILAWILALSEFLGGFGIILGVFPRVSSALIAFAMLVAMVKVHLPNGFFNMNGGIEFFLLMIAVAISIIILGAGKYSLYNKY